MEEKGRKGKGLENNGKGIDRRRLQREAGKEGKWKKRKGV